MTEPGAPFEMTLSLNVLEHLGIGLYSNVPSVLSEAVANAWDADADEVRVQLGKHNDTIEIRDTGTGMDRDDINTRFLRVGYQRRKNQGSETPRYHRAPMGRKGIGKLSLFSIAGIVEVYTIKNGEPSAFRMELEQIREAIQDGEESTYRPSILPTDGINFEKGTKIVLRDLKKRQTISTDRALRKRVARRFSIIGEQEHFQVFVNDKKITPEDRDYYLKMQYLWHYGDQSQVYQLCTGLARNPEERTGGVANSDITVSGWLGTVHKSGQLKDEESGDNLNRIAIFVRGKMAQEDILGDFSERGIYASYLIGELRVDDFDEDGKEDAATSSRQHLVEDDSRYVKLKEFLGEELKHIQMCWSEWRKHDGATEALREIPQLTEWINELPKAQQSKAKSWLGRIYRLRTNDEDERKQLLKQSVFAFEFYRANKNLESLEQINDSNLDAVLSIFQELDSLEASLYGQIVQQRISAIRTLQEKVNDNEREEAIQKYLYKHLWLLDPHWERAEASEHMEIQVGRLFKEIDAGLTDEEKQGRLDIQYQKSAGTHIIIELKRPTRIVNTPETIKQLEKYYSGMAKLLEQQESKEPFEIILIVGKEPTEWKNPDGQKRFQDTLKNYNARLVFYNYLLDDAYRSYADYLQKAKYLDRLQNIIQAIEDFGNPSVPADAT